MRSRARWLGVACLLFIVLAPEASAHVRPVRSFPEDQARLVQAPTYVWIDGSERLEGNARIQVLDASGHHHEVNGTRVHAYRATTLVDRLPEGGYLVVWDVVSMVDGHRTRGSWGFAVGNATPPAPLPLEEPPLRPLEVLAKAAAYGGLALAAGALVFWILTRADDPWDLEAWGARLLAGGFLLLLPVQAGWSPATISTFVNESSYGRGLLLRFMLGVAWAAVTLPRRWSSSSGAVAIRLGLFLALAASLGAAGHAAAQAGAVGAWTASLHVAAVAVWIGALVSLAGRVSSSDASEDLAKAALRFARLAGVCAAVAVLTGVGLAWAVLGSPAGWGVAAGGRYGPALAFKVAAAVVLLGFAGVNRFVHVRRLTTQATSFDRGEFGKNLRREIVVAGVVLLLAAIVTTLSPPGP